MARILVTGAAGFIGRSLCRCLAARGHAVIAATRHGSEVGGATPWAVGEIGPATPWADRLHGIDIVIHLANRAHRPPGRVAAALRNEPEAAQALARAAAAAGVTRLVYMSSIKVMGEVTRFATPFRAGQTPQPVDAYGHAKLATERALQAVAGVELVILRPPLVYGPGVGGNFAALIRLAGSGVPLPFAAIANRRSLIFVENLADLTAVAATHAAAAGQILLARDGIDWSTPELLLALGAGFDRPPRLFAMPAAVFAGVRRLPRIGAIVARLTLSLQVDDRPTRERLQWAAPVAAEAALAQTARAAASRPRQIQA